MKRINHLESHDRVPPHRLAQVSFIFDPSKTRVQRVDDWRQGGHKSRKMHLQDLEKEDSSVLSLEQKCSFLMKSQEDSLLVNSFFSPTVRERKSTPRKIRHEMSELQADHLQLLEKNKRLERKLRKVRCSGRQKARKLTRKSRRSRSRLKELKIVQTEGSKLKQEQFKLQDSLFLIKLRNLLLILGFHLQRNIRCVFQTWRFWSLQTALNNEKVEIQHETQKMFFFSQWKISKKKTETEKLKKRILKLKKREYRKKRQIPSFFLVRLAWYSWHRYTSTRKKQGTYIQRFFLRRQETMKNIAFLSWFKYATRTATLNKISFLKQKFLELRQKIVFFSRWKRLCKQKSKTSQLVLLKLQNEKKEGIERSKLIFFYAWRLGIKGILLEKLLRQHVRGLRASKSFTAWRMRIQARTRLGSLESIFRKGAQKQVSLKVLNRWKVFVLSNLNERNLHQRAKKFCTYLSKKVMFQNWKKVVRSKLLSESLELKKRKFLSIICNKRLSVWHTIIQFLKSRRRKISTDNHLLINESFSAFIKNSFFSKKFLIGQLRIQQSVILAEKALLITFFRTFFVFHFQSQHKNKLFKRWLTYLYEKKKDRKNKSKIEKLLKYLMGRSKTTFFSQWKKFHVIVQTAKSSVKNYRKNIFLYSWNSFVYRRCLQRRIIRRALKLRIGVGFEHLVHQLKIKEKYLQKLKLVIQKIVNFKMSTGFFHWKEQLEMFKLEDENRRYIEKELQVEKVILRTKEFERKTMIRVIKRFLSGKLQNALNQWIKFSKAKSEVIFSRSSYYQEIKASVTVLNLLRSKTYATKRQCFKGWVFQTRNKSEIDIAVNITLRYSPG
eukprot:snap_masked-scaffold_2-processed-gene-5.26-mRNA-1 protein AED:1.00 eAED:1.00 QI:0/0/0/0/1/1/3/0/833